MTEELFEHDEKDGENEQLYSRKFPLEKVGISLRRKVLSVSEENGTALGNVGLDPAETTTFARTAIAVGRTRKVRDREEEFCRRHGRKDG